MVDITKAKELVGYCGIFCGVSGLYKGRVMAEVANDLKELMEYENFSQEWLSKFGISFSIEDFLRGLNYFSNKNSSCYPQVPCKKGCGIPDCKVRECAKKKGIEICFECSEFPCKQFSQFEEKERLNIAKEYENFKKLGMEEWIKTQIQKADKGYCEATKKYYTAAMIE